MEREDQQGVEIGDNQKLHEAEAISPQYIRPPPLFKHGNDFPLYERRFRAYAAAIGCPLGGQPDLLLSLLEDEVLSSIDRHLTPNVTLAQLCELIRDAEGHTHSHNKDQRYQKELGLYRRGRNETMSDFYSALYRLALRAYPDSEEIREAMIRENFLSNMNESDISARCREERDLNNNMNNEQLLDLAILLQSCKEASKSSQIYPTMACSIDQVDKGSKLKAKSSKTAGKRKSEHLDIDPMLKMARKLSHKIGQQDSCYADMDMYVDQPGPAFRNEDKEVELYFGRPMQMPPFIHIDEAKEIERHLNEPGPTEGYDLWYPDLNGIFLDNEDN